ncbi:MAG: hypothetical protein KKF44_00745 [Nanoarchaeota archaeon]|nr:hypothetical protein [Nanoarchaeota archaeon]
MVEISWYFYFQAAFGLLFLTVFLHTSKFFPKHDQKKQSKRVPFFDYLKGIAIISVIAIHITDIFPEKAFLKDILLH